MGGVGYNVASVGLCIADHTVDNMIPIQRPCAAPAAMSSDAMALMHCASTV